MKKKTKKILTIIVIVATAIATACTSVINLTKGGSTSTISTESNTEITTDSTNINLN